MMFFSPMKEIVFNREILSTWCQETCGTSRAFPKSESLTTAELNITARAFCSFHSEPLEVRHYLTEHALQNRQALKNSDESQFFYHLNRYRPTKIVNGPYRWSYFLVSAWYFGVTLITGEDTQGNPQPYIERTSGKLWVSTTSLMQFRSGGLDTVAVCSKFLSFLNAKKKAGNFKIYNGGPAIGTTFISFNLNKGKRNGRLWSIQLNLVGLIQLPSDKQLPMLIVKL